MSETTAKFVLALVLEGLLERMCFNGLIERPRGLGERRRPRGLGERRRLEFLERMDVSVASRSAASLTSVELQVVVGDSLRTS